jgi:hypothetical protein
VVVASSSAINNMTNNSSKAKVRISAAPVFSEVVVVVADKVAVVTKIRIPRLKSSHQTRWVSSGRFARERRGLLVLIGLLNLAKRNSSKAKVRISAAPVFSEVVAVVADKVAVVTKIRKPPPRGCGPPPPLCLLPPLPPSGVVSGPSSRERLVVAVVADKVAVVTKIRIPLPRLRVPLPTVAT